MIVTGGPPVMATFLRIGFPSKNPTHCPSGEMKTPPGAPRPPITVDLIKTETRTWIERHQREVATDCIGISIAPKSVERGKNRAVA